MEFKQYVGKPMIAWLWYNPRYEGRFGGRNLVCYVSPRVLLGGNMEKIRAVEDFPENGRIEVFIQGGQSAGELFQKYGPLVSVKINREISPNYKGRNRYRLNFTPQGSGYGTVSDLTMERLSGKKFCQVLQTDQELDALKKSRFLDRPEGTPLVDRVLVRKGDCLYGPFAYEYDNGGVILESTKTLQYQVGEYPWTGELAGRLVEITNHEGKAVAEIIPVEALGEPRQTYDWISDKQLALACANVLNAGDQYTREQVQKIGETAESLMENSEIGPLTEERRQRIQSLMENLSSWNQLADGLLENAVKDEAVRESLAEAAAARHFDKIESQLTEHAGIQQKKEELRQQAEQLQREEEELREKQARFQQEETAFRQSETDFRREEKQLRQEVERLRGQEEDLRKRVAAYQDDLRECAVSQEKRVENPSTAQQPTRTDGGERTADYERKLRDLRAAYDYEQRQKERLDQSLKALLARYRDEAGQIVRLFDASILDGLMRSADSGVRKEDSGVRKEDSGTKKTADGPGRSLSGPVLPPFHPALLHAPMSRDEIVDRVSGAMGKGRRISRNDVANSLICVTQGFITTFTGRPGVGKTTFCDHLARSLGLATGDEQNRYVEIPVERGWTSHRDFIGAWNLAADGADIRNLEVWEAMARLDREAHTASEGGYAPFLMLLDEANLSPIEHYWSAFLRLCDAGSANRYLSAGGGKTWRIPPHLRFLATVNFDQTTEKLSPRFLDRSWIIPLDVDDIAETDEPENCADMVPWLSLEAAFRPSDSDAEDRELADKWNAIREIFRSRGIPVMPRNLKMVRDYCAAACGCMDRSAPEDRLAPLDYAFTQKILPTVSGSGEMFRELVYDLRRECTETSMPRSARTLARMQRIADSNGGRYQFFES